MTWLAVFATLRVLSSPEDAVKWCMGRRRDGFRDRRVGDQLATQGLAEVTGLWKGDTRGPPKTLKGSAPLFATSFESSKSHQYKNLLSKEQVIGRDREKEKYKAVTIDGGIATRILEGVRIKDCTFLGKILPIRNELIVQSVRHVGLIRRDGNSARISSKHAMERTGRQ